MPLGFVMVCVTPDRNRDPSILQKHLYNIIIYELAIEIGPKHLRSSRRAHFVPLSHDLTTIVAE